MRRGRPKRPSPFAAAALGAVEYRPEPLANPLPLRNARAVVLAVAAAAVDHKAVRRVATGRADAVGGGVGVIGSTVAAVQNHVLRPQEKKKIT